MPEHVVWQLKEGDADRAAEVMARAFHDEPVFVYAMSDPEKRGRMTRSIFRANIRHACRYGEALAVGRQPAEILGAVYWVLKPEPVLTRSESNELGFAAIARDWGDAIDPIGVMEGKAIATLPIPAGPWRYLAGLGVDPNWQRQGLGAALAGRVVADAFAAGLACGLVTDREDNLAFYRRCGFELIEGLETDGLRMWSMLSPRQAS